MEIEKKKHIQEIYKHISQHPREGEPTVIMAAQMGRPLTIGQEILHSRQATRPETEYGGKVDSSFHV